MHGARCGKVLTLRHDRITTVTCLSVDNSFRTMKAAPFQHNDKLDVPKKRTQSGHHFSGPALASDGLKAAT